MIHHNKTVLHDVGGHGIIFKLFFFILHSFLHIFISNALFSIYTSFYVPKFLLSVFNETERHYFQKVDKSLPVCFTTKQKLCCCKSTFHSLLVKIYHQLSMAQMNYKFVNVLNFTNRCNKPVSLAVPRNHRLGNLSRPILYVVSQCVSQRCNTSLLHW